MIFCQLLLFVFLYYVKVKVSVYKDNTEEAYFLFDGTKSNKTNWFSKDRLLNTSYTDLMNVNDSRNGYYFSIDGYVWSNTKKLFPFDYQLSIVTAYEDNIIQIQFHLIRKTIIKYYDIYLIWRQNIQLHCSPHMKTIICNYDVYFIWRQQYIITVFTSYEDNNIQLWCSPHRKAIIYNYDVHIIKGK